MELRTRLMKLLPRFGACMVAAAWAGGCIQNRTVAPDQSATAIDEEKATAAYWYEQPAAARAMAFDFDTLWAAAERVARNHRYPIDRVDYRNGILTTRPVASRQFFEVWRDDLTPISDQAESSLATVRRTIRFEFDRSEDGRYVVTPKVLIERYAMPQRRVTSVTRYGAAITPALPGEVVDSEGEKVPNHYWYAIGRDAAAERRLVRDIEARLRRS